MTVPTLNYVSCPDAGGSHRMAYWLWGAPDAPHLVVCAHGLSRQGRDFDTLAAALVEAGEPRVRVACPDVVGRGRSEWLADPMGYAMPTYVSDMLQMLAVLHAAAPVARLDWVGTSMGGLIGMTLAGAPGLPLPVPIHSLVLNDVGPVIEWSALQRIGGYLGNTGCFATVQEAAQAMWEISRGFGPHTPQQWLALSQAMVKSLPGGGFTLHYDPAIAVPFRALTQEAAAAGQDMLWQFYDAIQARTLLLRGADSDLLAPATAGEMKSRGPKPRLVEFAGVGHAPTLVAADQVAAVCDFLLAEQALSHEEPGSGTG